MSLPTKEKTWCFTYNKPGVGVVPSTNVRLNFTNNVGTDYQNLLWNWKTIILNMVGITPGKEWAVVGSCDSSVAALDGVDRWVTPANVVWRYGDATGSPFSWIVLKAKGINGGGAGGGAQLLLCCDGVYYYWPPHRSMRVYWSGMAGFTGGSTTTRPTATDEVGMLTGEGDRWYGPSYDTSFQSRLSFMMSSDGECTRAFGWAYNANRHVFIFDVPKVPNSGWLNPHVGGFGNWGASYGDFNDGASIRGRIGGATGYFYMTTEGYGTAMIGENLRQANEVDGNWQMSPIGLVSPTSGVRGRQGMLYDLWWGPNVRYNGDTYPGGTDRSFVQVGHLVFPWDGSVPQIS
jgi:hypothetical protein